MPGRIVVLDDEEKMVELLVRSLKRSGYDASGSSDPKATVELLKTEAVDVLLTDLRMPGLDGIQVLDRVKKISPSTDVILMTAFASVETVREAMKRGAVDYLVKPVSAENDLKPLLEKLLSDNDPAPVPTSRIKTTAVSETPTVIGLRCPSATMEKVYKKALKVAVSSASVLLRGESGTGKEVLADLIQANSPRKNAPYVKVNCGALPENLLESELFGHIKGSFTGAIADREGLFKTADGGTILLDEIGEVSPPLQVKLLRVLQQGEITRVGESRAQKVDVRVIAATNRPLEEMIEKGDFRQDLYYRLNVIPLEIPPLRTRSEDLNDLIKFFVKKFAATQQVRFSSAALQAMKQYRWPGNIRELENAVEHALVLGDPEKILPEDLPAAVQAMSSTEDTGTYYVNRAVESASLEEIEKRCLMQALEKTQGNRTQAARILNVTRRTLGYRLKKYHLEEEVHRRFGGSSNES